MAAKKANRTCSISGCSKKHAANGHCRMHYMRFSRHGSIEPTRRTNGTGTITKFGYISVGSNKRQEHIVIAEKAVGHPLPPGAEVHHHDENRANNANENLVVCPSRAYHFLLHQRMRALDACGNPGFRKCPFCKAYSDPEEMTKSKHGRHFYHSACKAEYRRLHAKR